MDQQNMILIAIVVLVGLAVYFTLTAEVTEPPVVDTAEAEALLMKGVEFGKGEGNYVISYSKISDGYKTNYELTKNEEESMVKVQNPLSTKKVYFLSNDTILCIKYPVEETCSSVEGDNRLENYLNSLKAEFFDGSRIEKNKGDMEYLLGRGYASLDPEVRDKTVGNSVCSEITYTLDFTNISLGEAARFGISSNTPRAFMRSMCIDNETGYRHEETLNYTFEGTIHTYTYQLLSFKPGSAGAITPPENLTDGAVDVLFQERTQQAKLADCFVTKEGEERERCISTMALQLRRKDLCEMAGERRDRCLVSIVPLTKDETICTAVTDLSYKDDCYIELAGAYRDSAHCDSIQNASKAEFCMEVSVPPEEPEVPEEEPEAPEENETTDTDILDFMEYLDDYGENQTGNESNSTG